MKYSISLIFIFALVYTVNSVKLDDVKTCINQACTNELALCEKDNVCSIARSCLEKCEFKDETCTHACYTPAAANKAFWTVGFCALDCAQTLERDEEDEIIECHMKNCNDYVKDCIDDEKCTEASYCYKECEKKDNECLADCSLKYLDNKPLLQVLHCDAACLSSFVEE